MVFAQLASCSSSGRNFEVTRTGQFEERHIRKRKEQTANRLYRAFPGDDLIAIPKRFFVTTMISETNERSIITVRGFNKARRLG